MMNRDGYPSHSDSSWHHTQGILIDAWAMTSVMPWRRLPSLLSRWEHSFGVPGQSE